MKTKQIFLLLLAFGLVNWVYAVRPYDAAISETDSISRLMDLEGVSIKPFVQTKKHRLVFQP